MKSTVTNNEAITPAEYGAFQVAYDFFNTHLFGGTLPHVPLQRHAKAKGTAGAINGNYQSTGRIHQDSRCFQART